MDEILARYIHPMASNARDVVTHKYHKPADGGDLTKLSAALVQEKSKNPSKIPYFFSASKQLPGKFVLAYQPSRKAMWEYFTATPDGYRFRSQVFETLDQMLKWFKNHYKDRPLSQAAHYGPGHTQTPLSGQSLSTPSSSNMFGTPMMISPFPQASPNQPYTPSQPTHWGTPGYGTPTNMTHPQQYVQYNTYQSPGQNTRGMGSGHKSSGVGVSRSGMGGSRVGGSSGRSDRQHGRSQRSHRRH